MAGSNYKYCLGGNFNPGYLLYGCYEGFDPSDSLSGHLLKVQIDEIIKAEARRPDESFEDHILVQAKVKLVEGNPG